MRRTSPAAHSTASGLWLELTDTFVGFNTAFTGDGGAVNGTWGSALLITDSDFDQNWAGQSGGAIWIDEGFLEIDRGVFVENFTAGGDGGAIWANLTPAYLIDSGFFGNLTAGNGGGIAGVASDLDVINAIFSGNEAAHGGAFASDGGSPTLTNLSVANNQAQSAGGGFYFSNGGIPRVANAVLWGNTDNDSGGNLSAMQITNSGSAPVVTYTCIQGGWSGAGGPGNVDADPLLTDADGADDVFGTPDDDLHALPGSPLIDAGSNFALSPQITTDYDGLPASRRRPRGAGQRRGIGPDHRHGRVRSSAAQSLSGRSRRRQRRRLRRPQYPARELRHAVRRESGRRRSRWRWRCRFRRLERSVGCVRDRMRGSADPHASVRVAPI